MKDPCEIKIETYWNVNQLYDCRLQDIKLIKIETYWNVNQIRPRLFHPA